MFTASLLNITFQKKGKKQIQWEKECLINGVETNSYLFGIKIKLDPYTLHHVEKYIYYSWIQEYKIKMQVPKILHTILRGSRTPYSPFMDLRLGTVKHNFY